MELAEKAQVYKPRKPQETSFIVITHIWQLLHHHFEEFESRYADLFSKEYGFYRPVISHVVRKYLGL